MAIYRQRSGLVEAVYFDGEDFLRQLQKGKTKHKYPRGFLRRLHRQKYFTAWMAGGLQTRKQILMAGRIKRYILEAS